MTRSDLEAAIQTYSDQTNAEPKPLVWPTPAVNILASADGAACGFAAETSGAFRKDE